MTMAGKNLGEKMEENQVKELSFRGKKIKILVKLQGRKQ